MTQGMPGFIFLMGVLDMTKKAIIFIDANNWYHNVKKYFKPSKIDITKVSNLIAKEKGLKILDIRWFVSVPSIADGEAMYYKHMSFLSHLRKQNIKVITRKLQRLSNNELKKKRQKFIESWDLCKLCKPIVEESFLDIADHQKKEKGIDVWIAIDMVKETILKNIDCVVLISGDADFVPAFDLIKEFKKEVLSASVPSGYSRELREKFPSFILGKEKLIKCLKDYKTIKGEEE
jgi:uncharacterized LabA/DUF88 family protein